MALGLVEKRSGANADDASVRPEAVVCGWCRHFGRPHGQVRSLRAKRWRPIAHEEAHAYSLAGRVSHGLCPACHSRLVEEWDR